MLYPKSDKVYEVVVIASLLCFEPFTYTLYDVAPAVTSHVIDVSSPENNSVLLATTFVGLFNGVVNE